MRDVHKRKLVMGFVLNEMECRSEANSRRFVCRLSGSVSLEARVFAPETLLNQIVPRTISFLPMAYLVAATHGERLDVNCQIGEVEWNVFLHEFVHLVSDFYGLPGIPLTRSAVLAPYAVKEPATRRAGLLFSAGIDSFYSLLKLREAAAGPDCLINVNAGADTNVKEWTASFDNLEQVAAKIGLPLVFIDTNFQHMFNKLHIASHTIRNVSAATLLSGLVSTVYYSSSEAYADLSYSLAKDEGVIGYIEPVFMASMRRQDIGAILFGLDSGRIKKTEIVKTSRIVQQHLDVCTNTQYQVERGARPLNCGTCMKCVRTLFTLDALGAVDEFGACFPVAQFRSQKPRLLQALERSPYVLDRQVVDLLRDRAALVEPD